MALHLDSESGLGSGSLDSQHCNVPIAQGQTLARPHPASPNPDASVESPPQPGAVELPSGGAIGSAKLRMIAHILLVDDKAYSRSFLSTILRRSGYQVHQAPSSSLALAAVQQQPPDLILLDVVMPDMDGYELCNQLKTNPATQDIPIIFLTALQNARDKVRAFQLGAADYITKPFQVEEVCARVHHQLELVRLQQQLAQQNQRLRQEQQRSEALLHNLLPATVADRLTHDSSEGSAEIGLSTTTIADSFAAATILFADIANFTAFASTMEPVALVELLNQIFSCFDQLAEDYGLEKIKTIGDAYMVAGGIPEVRPDHSEAIAHMALAMQERISSFATPSGQPLQLRIGIHGGPVVGGVIGIKRLSYDLWGDTVNVASRMELYSEPGRIQVSELVYRQLQQGFQLEPRGPITVKGKGEMNTYWLLGKR